jgi:general secretion pathway protein G
MQRPQCKRCQGFTFIELLMTLAIIAVLASIIYPMTELNRQRERERDLKAALREIRAALDAYKQAGDEGRMLRNAGESGYPKSLQDLVLGVENVKDPARNKIYFLRKLPRDSTFADSTVPAHLTWGLRSYSSPPDSPAAGADIFDVYSRSAGMGLNGVAYREW